MARFSSIHRSDYDLGLFNWRSWGKKNTLQWRHNGRDCVSNHQPYDCLLNPLFRRRSKKTSKLRVTDLCVGNSPGTGEFPAQMASYAENVSIWWRHHEYQVLVIGRLLHPHTTACLNLSQHLLMKGPPVQIGTCHQKQIHVRVLGEICLFWNLKLLLIKYWFVVLCICTDYYIKE